MFVTSKELYDSYCSWLFSIFAEVEKRICLETGEDAYHKRVFGFISEFLLLVWVTVQGLSVCECKVCLLYTSCCLCRRGAICHCRHTHRTLLTSEFRIRE